MSPSDPELAQRAASGERDAFREILERHYGLLYRLSYRFFGNVQDAEDVTQEICLSLASRIAGFEGRSRFSTWLYQVAINACRDHQRRLKSLRRLDGASAQLTAEGADDAQDTATRLSWLHSAIQALEAPLKETVLLVVDEELSHRDAAEILGVAETTVSWRMHEVKKRLKALLESADG